MTGTVDTRSPGATAAPGSRRRGGVRTTLARRWPTGIGVAAVATGLTALAPLPDQVHAWVSAWCVLLAAVVYLAWGTVRGDLGDRRLLTAQTAAVLAFGAAAMAAVSVDPAAGRYVLAAGWLAHAAWDVVHHRIGRVVPGWYAETCLVADLLIATALLTVGIV